MIVALALREHLGIDIAHLHQMLIRKHLLLIQVRMQLPDNVPIGHRGAGGSHLHNQMRGIRLTGLG